jgi:hypothetical protein
MEKITCADSDQMFSEIAPPHTSLSFQNVNDGVLFAVVPVWEVSHTWPKFCGKPA